VSDYTTPVRGEGPANQLSKETVMPSSETAYTHETAETSKPPETPAPPSLSPVVAAALSDPSLTAEERANIKLVIKFRGLPFAERALHTVENFKPTRIGMATLAEFYTATGPGYSGQSIPDRVDETLDIIAHGDRVWSTWLIRGTHRGPLYGIEPTGRTLEVLELGQWRIRDGLIAEAWFFVDELALLRQLGHLPPGLARALGAADDTREL
jgi:hypothetical protein